MSVQRRQSARGFTLVELLVVIAIIGVLVALLLPAIQAAREAARRSQCLNNLKQLGLAVQLHHNAKRFYPTGRNASDTKSVSWAFYCLPYMEQQAMFQAYRPTSDVFAPENATTFRSPVATFFCPTLRPPAADRDFDDNDGSTTIPADAIGKAAGGDYGANAGNSLGADGSDYDPESSGPIFSRSKINERHVTDGLSNTFAIGEKYLGVPDPDNPPPIGREGAMLGDCAIFAGDNPDTILRSADDGFPPSPVYSPLNKERFGSSHTDLANFVYLDGSVHSISYSISQIVFENLGNIGDDQVIPATY